MWELSKATKYLERALRIIAKHLGLKNHADAETLDGSYRTFVFEKNDDSESHTRKLKLLFMLVKGFLQNGAVKSQAMNHEDALLNVNLGKFYLKTLIFNLQELIKIYSKTTRSLEKEVAYSHEDERAYFSPFLQYPELKKFKHFNSNSALVHDFEKFIKEVLSNDPTENYSKNQATTRKSAKDSGLKSVIFWKHNLENNEKYFKKELSARSRDLGVSQKFTTMWIRDFNIGNVMHVKPVSYLKLSAQSDFFEHFSVKMVVEVVLTYCCCLFSIATENRFICQKELEDDMKSNELKGPDRKASKLWKLQRNPNFIES